MAVERMNEELKKEIWKILNLLKGNISADRYHVILFLLALQKEGLLEDLKGIEPYEKRFKLYDLIDGDLIAHNEIYEDLYDKVYKSIFASIDPDTFSKIIDGIFLVDEVTSQISYSTVFEEILSYLLTFTGKVGLFSNTPKPISDFAFSLIEISQHASIYNPFAGTGSFGMLVKDTQSYYGQELNIFAYSIGMLRLFAHQYSAEMYLLNEDSINQWYPIYEGEFGTLGRLAAPSSERKRVDLVISNPPFGYRLKDDEHLFGKRYNAETLVLDQGLDILSEGGKIVCIVSHGVLFRGGEDRNIRKRLIDNDYLEMVISFPGEILPGTSIPFCIIVVNKDKKDKGSVKFVDASTFIKKKTKNEFDFKAEELLSFIVSDKESDFIRIVDNSNISDHNYNLSGNQYFVNIKNGIKLAELVKIDRSFVRNNIEGTTALRINFSDLNNNIKLDYGILKREAIKKNDFILDASCFLFGTFNGQLKFSHFEYDEENYACSSNMIPLRIDEQQVTVPYFAKQLTELYFQEQFTSFSKGAAIQKVSKTDLLKIVISVISIAEQERQRESLENYFDLADKNLLIVASLENQLFEQASYLRHSLAGPTRNVLTFIKRMMSIMDNNPDLKAKEIMTGKLNSIDRYSFKDMRQIVERDLIKVENVIKNQLDIQEQILSSKLELMDIDVFLSEYSHSLEQVHPSVIIEYESFVPYLLEDVDKSEYVTVRGNQDLLRTMLDNLFENARQHAFKENLDKKFLIKLNYDEDSGVLSIEVANSGDGFPKDIDFKEFISKNKKSNESFGNGFGGWYIYQVIRHHKGELEIDDNSVFKPDIADGYATSFYINLPLANEEIYNEL